MSIDKRTYSFQQNELSGNDLVHRMSARDTTFHNRHEFFGVSTREYSFFSNTLISLSLDSKEALRVCSCSSVWVCNACRVKSSACVCLSLVRYLRNLGLHFTAKALKKPKIKEAICAGLERIDTRLCRSIIRFLFARHYTITRGLGL